MYFRGLDQAQPSTQRKMLHARQVALDTSDFLSESLTPPFTWLGAFQAFVADQQPNATLADGAISREAFYDLLPAFLDAEVCSRTIFTPLF